MMVPTSKRYCFNSGGSTCLFLSLALSGWLAESINCGWSTGFTPLRGMSICFHPPPLYAFSSLTPRISISFALYVYYLFLTVSDLLFGSPAVIGFTIISVPVAVAGFIFPLRERNKDCAGKSPAARSSKRAIRTSGHPRPSGSRRERISRDGTVAQRAAKSRDRARYVGKDSDMALAARERLQDSSPRSCCQSFCG